MVKVRLYRPFSAEHFAAGAAGDGARRSPCSTAPRSRAPRASRSTRTWSRRSAKRMADGTAPFDACRAIVGGRYGLSSKEFTPAMVKGVFDELAKPTSRRTTSPSASTTT